MIPRILVTRRIAIHQVRRQTDDRIISVEIPTFSDVPPSASELPDSASHPSSKNVSESVPEAKESS